VGARARADLERLEDGPPIPVYLDPGSFKWLLEILRAKKKTQIWLEPYQRLVDRTILSFEEAIKDRAIEETAPEPVATRSKHRKPPPKRKR
jgi:hypothetical protein